LHNLKVSEILVNNLNIWLNSGVKPKPLPLDKLADTLGFEEYKVFFAGFDISDEKVFSSRSDTHAGGIVWGKHGKDVWVKVL